MVDAIHWLNKYLDDGKTHELKKLQADARCYGLVRGDIKAARKAIGHIETCQVFSPCEKKVVWAWRKIK